MPILPKPKLTFIPGSLCLKLQNCIYSHPPTPTKLSPVDLMATTPEASPAPSNSTGNFFNEKNNEIKEIHEDTYLPSKGRYGKNQWGTSLTSDSNGYQVIKTLSLMNVWTKKPRKLHRDTWVPGKICLNSYKSHCQLVYQHYIKKWMPLSKDVGSINGRHLHITTTCNP